MPNSATKAFQLKGSSFTLPILQLLSNDIDQLSNDLAETIRKTPNFFNNMPLVIDLSAVDDTKYINFEQLLATLKKHHLLVVGIRNASDKQKISANNSHLAVLADQKTTIKTNAGQKQPAKAKIITKQIRSGQQVYAPDGDLIILASVSAGAECLAHGNIHVYGTLRGRALAGVNGDTDARIFARQVGAEILSIAGRYKLQDDIRVPNHEFGCEVLLEDDQIQLKKL